MFIYEFYFQWDFSEFHTSKVHSVEYKTVDRISFTYIGMMNHVKLIFDTQGIVCVYKTKINENQRKFNLGKVCLLDKRYALTLYKICCCFFMYLYYRREFTHTYLSTDYMNLSRDHATSRNMWSSCSVSLRLGWL